MYNNESHLRTNNFLSKKITKTAVKIKHGQAYSPIVGDLNAEVDWGYAPDYIEAMHQILPINKPDDFVISTGIKSKLTK